MSFDAWVVAFGLSRVLIELKLVTSPMAYSVLLTTLVIDAYLLYNFFTVKKKGQAPTHRPVLSSQIPAHPKTNKKEITL